MRSAAIAFIGVVVLSASPALAGDVAVDGGWTVHGKVGAFGFDLMCRFERRGDGLGGICYDGGTRKPHPLTRGSIVGDHISWTYQSSYLLNKFDANYSGLISGTAIKGEITVPGRAGTFSAEKQP